MDKARAAALLARGDSAEEAVDPSRCLARTWNHGRGIQCSKARPADRDFCAQHQAAADSEKGLPHGRYGDDVPLVKRAEFRKQRLSNETMSLTSLSAPMPVAATDIPVIESIRSAQDAPRLVRNMQNAPSFAMRMGTLQALDRTPQAQLPAFVSSGGLPVLEKLIRIDGHCRFACLTVLAKLPVSAQDIRPTKLEALVEQISQAKGGDKEEQMKATSIIQRWRADSVFAEPSAAAAESRKRPRPEALAAPAAARAEAQRPRAAVKEEA